MAACGSCYATSIAFICLRSEIVALNLRGIDPVSVCFADKGSVFDPIMSAPPLGDAGHESSKAEELSRNEEGSATSPCRSMSQNARGTVGDASFFTVDYRDVG